MYTLDTTFNDLDIFDPPPQFTHDELDEILEEISKEKILMHYRSREE